MMTPPPNLPFTKTRFIFWQDVFGLADMYPLDLHYYRFLCLGVIRLLILGNSFWAIHKQAFNCFLLLMESTGVMTPCHAISLYKHHKPVKRLIYIAIGWRQISLTNAEPHTKTATLLNFVFNIIFPTLPDLQFSAACLLCRYRSPELTIHEPTWGHNTEQPYYNVSRVLCLVFSLCMCLVYDHHCVYNVGMQALSLISHNVDVFSVPPRWNSWWLRQKITWANAVLWYRALHRCVEV